MKKCIGLSRIMMVSIYVLIFSSFSIKSGKENVFTGTTFYYNDGSECQRIEPGYNCCTGWINRSLIQANFTSSELWSTISNSGTAWTGGSASFVWKFTIDLETTSDGDDDGQITLQEALDGLWAHYTSSTPHFISDDAIFIDANSNGNGSWVTFYKAATTH